MTLKPMTIFMLLKTRPEWLQLDRAARAEIAEKAFADALSAKNGISYRHYDAEAFAGRCTDIAVFEAADPGAYYFAIEKLRDTPIFSKPYFDIVDIIPTFQNGYLAFEQSLNDAIPQTVLEASHAI